MIFVRITVCLGGSNWPVQHIFWSDNESRMKRTISQLPAYHVLAFWLDFNVANHSSTRVWLRARVPCVLSPWRILLTHFTTRPPVFHASGFTAHQNPPRGWRFASLSLSFIVLFITTYFPQLKAFSISSISYRRNCKLGKYRREN